MWEQLWQSWQGWAGALPDAITGADPTRSKKPITTCLQVWLTLQQLQHLTHTLPAALSSGDPAAAAVQGKTRQEEHK